MRVLGACCESCFQFYLPLSMVYVCGFCLFLEVTLTYMLYHVKESLGHADISLRDLRGMSKRINETYTLVDGHGKIQVVLDWQAV